MKEDVNFQQQGVKNKKKQGRGAALLLAVLCLLISLSGCIKTGYTKEKTELPAESTFSIHFIDVGQADAALVECDGEFMLVDGGDPDDYNTIYSALEDAGADHISILVASHPHSDHIGSLHCAYDYGEVDITLCPASPYESYYYAEFLRYANENGGITTPEVGDIYTLGSSDIEILWVDGGEWEDLNNASIVLKITYGDTVFLFTGDAEREAEQAILEMGADLSATVLKVGHHGSNSSTTYPFLRQIMPSYAVISVGEGNDYGHPSEGALSRLSDAGAEVYRTDLDGDIYLASDGINITISAVKGR